MAYVYMMSDPHGCLDVLERALAFCNLDAPENRVFLLGDYIPHAKYHLGEGDFAERCAASLAFVKAFCERHTGRAVALMGNHEHDIVEEARFGRVGIPRALVEWAAGLPLFAETERQILVHAGIDESYAEYWQGVTYDYTYLGKRPATLGAFPKDIVAGHTGTRSIASENGADWDVSSFNGALWDGESHYFLDGTTELSGVMPVLRYDTEAEAYESFLAAAEDVRPDGGPKCLYN